MIKFILPIFLILSSVTVFSDGDADKCIYCGSRAYGACPNSPIKIHEHIGNSETCVYCGSRAYGACARSPEKLHKHGHGDDKCIWCGSKATKNKNSRRNALARKSQKSTFGTLPK